MRIAMGVNHAGFSLKGYLTELLEEEKHSVIDLGTHSLESVEDQDYAEVGGKAVIREQAERGYCGESANANHLDP